MAQPPEFQRPNQYPPAGQQYPPSQGYGPVGVGPTSTPGTGYPQGHQSAGATPPSAPAQSGAAAPTFLALVAPVMLVLGLIWDGAYTRLTLWSVFATVLAVAITALVITGQGARFAIAAAGMLGIYWVAMVLPGIASNPGFLLTLAVGCALFGTYLRFGSAEANR